MLENDRKGINVDDLRKDNINNDVDYSNVERKILNN
jgi:hypothetical protein